MMLSIAADILSLIGGPLGRLIGGERGEKIANAVVSTAQRVTGTASPDAALDTLRQDPAAVAKLQSELISLDRSELEAETERLRVINATMQAEAASADPFVRRWRPTWGYVTAYAWAAQVGATVLAVVAAAVLAITGDAAKGATLLTAVAGLWEASFASWGIALTVLGLQVHARSRDKAVGAGLAPTGVLQSLAVGLGSRVRGR
jgi:hypothetical protein